MAPFVCHSNYDRMIHSWSYDKIYVYSSTEIGVKNTEFISVIINIEKLKIDIKNMKIRRFMNEILKRELGK